MYQNLARLAGLSLLAGMAAGPTPASAVDLAPPAYVNQLDLMEPGAPPQLGDNGSVYVDQLSPDARPVQQKKKKVARREDAIHKVNKPTIPDVGTGVSLALSRSQRDAELPNVGRGVVR